MIVTPENSALKDGAILRLFENIDSNVHRI